MHVNWNLTCNLACLSGHFSSLNSSLKLSTFLFKYWAMSIETYPATLFPFDEKSVIVNAHFFSLNNYPSK